MILTPQSTPPLPTPAATLAGAQLSAFHVRPRQTDFLGGNFDYTYDVDCLTAGVAEALQCTSIIESCYTGLGRVGDYLEAATSCYCNYGIPYLECYYDKVFTGSCASYLGITDWGEYQRSFYTDYCGSIPPSAMAQIQPPSSVSLDFETVEVVTATEDIPQPNYGGQPSYQGNGALLQGACAETGFTRVDAGNTIYFAGFMGCINDRPECCPWAVATPTGESAGRATDAAGVNVQDPLGYDFPKPLNKDLTKLASCAEDYYSISGGCCPTGFWPFTSAVGGQTPCWSSVNRVDVPTLTVRSDEPEIEKPTSAVVNIVWSMRFPVAEPESGGLSTGAKAGIGAGAGVAAILIIGLAICLWRSRRKNKKLAQGQQPPQPGQMPPPQQQHQQPPFQQSPPMMQQQPGMPNGQYPPGAYPPGMVAPHMSVSSGHSSGAPSMGQTSFAALVPQNTGTSGGGVSELSSQSGQSLLHNGQPGGGFVAGAAAANPRVSYGSGSSGAGTPGAGGNGQGYPAPIAEADEGQHPYAQYGYQEQQQQPPQQYYGVPQQQQQQQQYYGAPQEPQPQPYQMVAQNQYYPPQQGGYAYPQQQQQQQPLQQGYYPPQAQSPPPANIPEMSANREADPPQEVMGSQVPPGFRGQ